MKTVFVVNYLSDPADDMSFACTCGVFETKEKAQKWIEEDFEDTVEREGIDKDGEAFEQEITKSDNTYRIYDFGSVYEWTITEIKIDWL